MGLLGTMIFHVVQPNSNFLVNGIENRNDSPKTLWNCTSLIPILCGLIKTDLYCKYSRFGNYVAEYMIFLPLQWRHGVNPDKVSYILWWRLSAKDKLKAICKNQSGYSVCGSTPCCGAHPQPAKLAPSQIQFGINQLKSQSHLVASWSGILRILSSFFCFSWFV